MVNVAEETGDASRTVPRAIVVTLVATTALYVLVAAVAVRAVPIAELAASGAPLTLIFERASGHSGGLVSALALVSVLNGALIQTVMASRMLYGLSRRRALPEWLGRVHPRTGTPLASTVLCVALIVVLATTLPIVTLAEAASLVTLAVFAVVDFALLRIKMRASAGPEPPFRVPAWLPALGLIASLGLLVFGLWQRLAMPL
jgi:amino acid transporter